MKRRGFLLVTTLLFIIVLLLLGMGFLGMQAARYRAVTRAGEEAQARALAVAGLEDARVKMENDLNFPPPPSGPGQLQFSYSEQLGLGSYTVTIDRKYELPPAEVIRITATGSLGPADVPIAQRTLRAELDVALKVRGGTTDNPRYFHYTHVQDEGSL